MPDLPLPLEEPFDTAPAAPAAERVRRQWQQPLGEIHNKLSNIVGAGSLGFSFDCNDQDFVFALTSRWPLGNDFTHSLYETDTLKLADALNGLVRLYAIETGQERLHVLLEARRGKPELPGWWKDAPVMVATYAFDTNFAQVGLFGELADAYEDMEMLNHPHRLLVAIGPATPIMVDADGGEIVLDGDEDRLESLRRWNQRLALQINQLVANTFGGDESDIEAVVEALSKVRDLSGRLAAQLIERESRSRRRAAKRDEPLPELRARLRQMPQLEMKTDTDARREIRLEHQLGETLAGLQSALKSDSLNGAMNSQVRADLQKSLNTLVTKPKEPKKQESSLAQKAPERRPLKPDVSPIVKAAPKPGAAMLIALCLLAFNAVAKDKGEFGLSPYRDTMRYYEYADNTDARLSSGGNGTVTPKSTAIKPAKKIVKKKTAAKKDDSYKPAEDSANKAAPDSGPAWEEDKNNCAGRAAHTARRRYGNVPIEVFSDGSEGSAFIDGKRYTYRCSGDPQTGLLEFRADKVQ